MCLILIVVRTLDLFDDLDKQMCSNITLRVHFVTTV